MMPPGRRDLEGPLGFDLTDDVGKIEAPALLIRSTDTGGQRPAVCVKGFVRRLGVRRRFASEQGNQVPEGGHADDLDALHQLGLRRLTEGHDGPAKARLGGRQDGGQDSPDGSDASVEAELAQEHGAGQLARAKTPAAASTEATIARS